MVSFLKAGGVVTPRETLFRCHGSIWECIHLKDAETCMDVTRFFDFYREKGNHRKRKENKRKKIIKKDE